MSICPTCGHWVPEPVPEELEDSIKPCRTCASRQRSGDAELVESAGKYHVRCYGCHLSTGDYNDPREAVAEWNALWEGVEGPQEAAGGLGSGETTKLQTEEAGGHTGETRGINGSFSIVKAMEIAKEMLLEAGGDIGQEFPAATNTQLRDWGERLAAVAKEEERMHELVNRLLPLAMAAGAKDGKLKTAAEACFKEATELLENIVEVEDGK